MLSRSAFPATFYGDPNTKITSIDPSAGITMSRTSGTIPAFVHVSASAILASGSVLDTSGTAIAGVALRPYEHLEYNWDFGDSLGKETFTDPVTGLTRDANHDQWGPEAVYCYRTASATPYTITLRIRGKSGSAYVYSSITKQFTANAFSGTAYYFDSRVVDDTGDGTVNNPWKNLRSHGPIDVNGNVTSSNVQINIANGSNYSFAQETFKGLSLVTGIRITGWNNPNNPSTVKPILQCTSNSTGNGVIFASNTGTGYSDHVYSSLSIQAASSITVAITPVNFLSPKGEKKAMTMNASISGTTLTAPVTTIYTGYNNTITNSKIFSVTGNVTQDTTISSGGPTVWTVNNSQNIAADDMVILPVATCAAFTGSITSNTLTCSAPPGYSSLTGCGTPAAGQLIIDFTGNVGLNRKIVSSLGGNQYTVSSGADVSSELMYCGPQSSVVSDIYIDNCDVINNSDSGAGGVGGNGISFNVSANSIFDPKTVATNMSVYGGKVSCLTGNAGAAIQFGAAQWMSWFGVAVSVTGAGVAGQGAGAQVHQINPESMSSHGLVRWLSTDAGGLTNSGMNFAFEPRNFNGYNGTKLGDATGGFIHIADSKFTYATNGVNGGNQANVNPSTSIGFYDGFIVERCAFGWITNNVAFITGVKNTTFRDLNCWQVGTLITVPIGTAQGLGAWMPCCVYRNKIYRASNANQGQYGSLTGQDTYIVKLTDSTYSLPQEFTDNVVWDDRTDAATWNVIVSDQVTAKSIYDRNQYYAPNISGAPTGTYLVNNATPETLATWKTHGGGGFAFDPNSSYLTNGPGWADAPNGKF